MVGQFDWGISWATFFEENGLKSRIEVKLSMLFLDNEIEKGQEISFGRLIYFQPITSCSNEFRALSGIFCCYIRNQIDFLVILLPFLVLRVFSSKLRFRPKVVCFAL